MAAREREFVRVAGADAADYLQRMVSNDVEALSSGEACPALLLTAKARVIAPLVVLRRAEDEFLLLTEPGLGEVVRGHLTRMRMRAECTIEPEEHEAVLVFGGTGGFATDWPGASEAVDAGLEPTLSGEELELRRIESGVPRWEREIDDRILPAEAALDQTHVSFSKGCYPGQEPV
ncbi:MAG: YgfZ/GcvT domain-containing protein, partial [Gaiellaceae bacterium]